MKTTIRVILSTLACIAALVLVIGGGAWWWWRENSAELVEAGKTARAEGQSADAVWTRMNA